MVSCHPMTVCTNAGAKEKKAWTILFSTCQLHDLTSLNQQVKKKIVALLDHRCCHNFAPVFFPRDKQEHVKLYSQQKRNPGKFSLFLFLFLPPSLFPSPTLFHGDGICGILLSNLSQDEFFLFSLFDHRLCAWECLLTAALHHGRKKGFIIWFIILWQLSLCGYNRSV